MNYNKHLPVDKTKRLFLTSFHFAEGPGGFIEAILYLSNDSNYNNKAILIFGSTNKKLFNETNKTDYLNVLAKVISIQFNNLMDYKNERKAQNNF